MQRFSSNGSPTCTDGRFASSPSAKPADASTLAPPMPSRPVDDPSSTARLPTPSALASTSRSIGSSAEAQHVDERVLRVALVEDDLAADRRHADRVAVAADAGDHAVEQVARAGVGERAEAQRVHERDRSRAHREDVADDPADAGGRALVRLHRGRMVVALDAHRDREAVADVDHAGALARADEHPGRVGRELAEVLLRRLVRAVLRPHHRVHRDLELGRVAPEQVDDRGQLVVGEPELAVQRRSLVRMPAAWGVGSRNGGGCDGRLRRGGRCAHPTGWAVFPLCSAFHLLD